MNIKYSGNTVTITVDIDITDEKTRIQDRIDNGNLEKEKGAIRLDSIACRKACQAINEYVTSLTADLASQKAAKQAELDKLNAMTNATPVGGAVLADKPADPVAP